MNPMRKHLARLCAPMAGIFMLAATPTLAFADAPTGAPIKASENNTQDCKLRLVGRPPYKRNLRMCDEAPAVKLMAEDDQCTTEDQQNRSRPPYQRDCAQLAD